MLFYTWQVLVGGVCGTVACIALVAAGAIYARYKNNARTQAQPLPERAEHDDDTRLREFHKQLDCLRVSVFYNFRYWYLILKNSNSRTKKRMDKTLRYL